MTRETIKEYILQVKSQDGTEALYNRWEPDILVEVINEIFNDHEEQLKAKDKEIERLKADIIKASYADGKLRKLAQVVDKPLDQALKLLDSNFTK